MAKRRHLKKVINGICGNLFANTVAVSLLNKENQPSQAIDGILNEILCLQNEYIVRISHTEKGSERAFYAKLRKEFETKVEQLIEKIKELN